MILICVKAEASGEKESGNAAYSAGDYEKAIAHFSRCIELDARFVLRKITCI